MDWSFLVKSIFYQNTTDSLPSYMEVNHLRRWIVHYHQVGQVMCHDILPEYIFIITCNTVRGVVIEYIRDPYFIWCAKSFDKYIQENLGNPRVPGDEELWIIQDLQDTYYGANYVGNIHQAMVNLYKTEVQIPVDYEYIFNTIGQYL